MSPATAAWAWAWLLATARLWAMVRVQPSWRSVLGRRWDWIAGVLAAALGVAGVALVPGAGMVAAMPTTVSAAATVLGFELLLGSVLGLAASLCGWALIGATVESERGLALGVDRGEAPQTLATLLIAASLATALALGLHAPLLRGALGSLDHFPLGAPGRWFTVFEDGGRLAALGFEACVLALALASPVLLMRALVEVVVASLARGPEPSATLIAGVVPGLRVCLALVALGAAWSSYPQAFARGL